MNSPQKPVRDRKAYLLQWYLKNRESEIKSACQRKRAKLDSMSDLEYAVYLQGRKKEGRITRLRRDVKRACDPETDQAYRARKAMQSKVWRERLKADPVRSEQQRLKKQQRMQRLRAGLAGEATQKSTVFKIKEVRSRPPPKGPSMPAGFKAAQKFAQIFCGGLQSGGAA
jgi:hypothetical protein